VVALFQSCEQSWAAAVVGLHTRRKRGRVPRWNVAGHTQERMGGGRGGGGRAFNAECAELGA
jgi:hypothetical protein